MLSMHGASLTRLVPLRKLRHWRNPRGAKFRVDDLIQSFDHAPQLQNIVVRRLPGPRDEYEVISGHRRVEAARRKGWGHIEAKVVEVADETAEAYALEENLRRKALPDEPSAVARLLAIYDRTSPVKHGGDRRSKEYQRSKAQVAHLNAATRAAEVIGQSASEVRRKARIGRLGTAKVKRALAEKQINILEASNLAGLAARQQDRRLSSLLKAKGRTQPREVRKALDALAYVEKVLRSGHGRSALRRRLADLVELAGAPRGLGGPRSREPVIPSRAVHFEAASCNRKLGPVALAAGRERPHFQPMRPLVASTLVSIQATCPDSCAFKGAPGAPGGCYVDSGFTRIAMEKLDSAAWKLSSLEVIAEEVRQVDNAFGGGPIPQDGARGGRDLRLHVGGDVGTLGGARLLATATRRWRARGGGTVWTYTHNWREVPRREWGDAVSVLASVERPGDIAAAAQRGYASAIVVEQFPGSRVFELPGAKVGILPCPAETRGTNCAECRLCLDRDLLAMKVAIGFELHGQHKTVARQALALAVEGRGDTPKHPVAQL
jgi:ParB/RepB/Spo0J family partition protein